ncbi:hypothetical protein FSC37_09695 [Piscinibacter aquaticus]|uniref:Carrier domain-containing protein n=1 Tax=Piscinibacter aquaticus TaxID=392597 RepID=A0A5C6U341_9BURK|nr:hypothetical protein FSC37_09695 [Piscinibacter aquaticus]
MAMDWQVLRRARRAHALALVRGREDVGASDVPATGLAPRLAGLDVPERRALLEPAVRDAVGSVLKLAPARIDSRKALGAMGLNSLMAMELRNRLEVLLEQPLSATIAWNYPSVDALVGYLSGLGSAGVAAAAEPAAAAVTSPALAALSAMSDEEAAQLLRRRR